MMRCARIAGTAGPDADGDGVPDNQLTDAGAPLQIAGQPIYDNGWLAWLAGNGSHVSGFAQPG